VSASGAWDHPVRAAFRWEDLPWAPRHGATDQHASTSSCPESPGSRAADVRRDSVSGLLPRRIQPA